MENPLHRLTDEQIEALAREFDELHEEVKADLGDRDAAYIRGIIALHRRLGLIARMELLGASSKPAWVLGTLTLSVAKILENMEIGHNVLHGQWDWMNDPVINSSAWDWDTASTAEAWKHSHNYIHHTYTNIRGKDKDLGYEIMRIDPHQKWHPVYLLQPFYNVLLMFLFEWGVAFHDLDLEAVRSGEKSQKEVLHELKGIAGKARTQITKDYIAWPLVSAAVVGAVHWLIGPSLTARGERRRDKVRRRSAKVFARARGKGVDTRLQHALEAAWQSYRATALANATANIVRNVWAHSIIMCGHFPEGVETFERTSIEGETHGEWYLRQMLGSANISGSKLMHIMSGNLSHQIEHHLFPDLPSNRYAEIAPRVRALCEQFGLQYNTGSLLRQTANVWKNIFRLALPGPKA